MGKITIEVDGFKQLLGITDQIFAVCGDEPAIQFWTIDDDEWPFEPDIFVKMGALSPLATAPEDMLLIPEGKLAVWNKQGQIAIIAAAELEIVSTVNLNNELASVTLTDQGVLICACVDGTVEFLNMEQGTLRSSFDSIKSESGLQSVLAYDDHELLVFSKGKNVQRWNIKKRDKITLGIKFSIINDLRKSNGNVLFEGQDGLIYFDESNHEFYQLESTRERLILYDQMGEVLCQWHFTRAGDRELYEPAAITPKGVLMTIAKGELRRLQVMRSGEVGFDQFN